MDVIFDIRGAAEYLHIKKWTLYRLAKKQKVPAIKVGGQWRFKKEVLDGMFTGEKLRSKEKPPIKLPVDMLAAIREAVDRAVEARLKEVQRR